MRKSPGPWGPGLFQRVGDTGIEPVTSSVSGKRATAAPIARDGTDGYRSRWVRDSNPCTRLCRPLPRLSANPPGDALASYGTALPTRGRERRSPGADDRIRTGDPHLGKVMLYQLSYVRRTAIRGSCRGRYWDRTSDLFRVKEARYPCANRPFGSSAHRSGLEESYTGSEMVRARSSVTCVPPPSQNACPSPLSEQLGAHHRRLESPDIAGSHSGPPGITASPSGRLRAAGSIPPCGTGERTPPGRPRR